MRCGQSSSKALTISYFITLIDSLEPEITDESLSEIKDEFKDYFNSYNLNLEEILLLFY
jgi:hypothetical protein